MALNVKLTPKKETLEKLTKLYPDFRSYYIEAIQELFALSNELEKALEIHHGRNGITRARYLTLLVLSHCGDKRMPPNEIATALNVTRGNMTGLIDALLKDGYVKKYADQEDRRQCWVELTAEGEAFLKKLMPENFRRIAKLMSVITRAEIDSLISIARKLRGGLCALTDDQE